MLQNGGRCPTRRRLATVCGLAATLCASEAGAGTPERDKAWDVLIEQAKAHGGAETQLDRSVSYVFQRPEGSYVAFTRLSTAKGARSVCLIAKDENATLCVDWDTGKTTLGDRADAATPWKFHSAASLDALEAEKPGFVDSLLSAINGLLGGSRSSGYLRSNKNGSTSWVTRHY